MRYVRKRRTRRGFGNAARLFRLALIGAGFVTLSSVAEAATAIPFRAVCTFKIEGRAVADHLKCEGEFYGTSEGPLTCGSGGGAAADHGGQQRRPEALALLSRTR